MTGRLLARIAAAGLVGALATGCVTQPLDESALELATERMGATPAALDDAEAKQVADEAQTLSRRHAKGPQRRDGGVWTAPRRGGAGAKQGGGLVRVDATEDSDPSGGGDDSQVRRDSGEDQPRESQDDGGDKTSDDGKTAGDDDRSGADDPVASGDDRDGDTPAGEGSSSPRPRPSPRPSFQAIAGASDPGDDASGQSPRYADIRQLVVESDGTNARVTVAVAGDIPQALNEGEVQGIGVDFYRSNDKESDYQLFVDGDDEGWRAYLHTPNGIVDYPGSFGIGGRVFVLELPWSALGGRKPADVNMFIDWSQRDTPLNKAGNDRAPNGDRVRVDPR